jgi:type I restriction enzyme M protein
MTKPIRIEHFMPCIEWWGGIKRKGRETNAVAWKVTAEEIKARGYNLDFKNPHTIAEDYGDPEELLTKLEGAQHEATSLREQLKNILGEALLR